MNENQLREESKSPLFAQLGGFSKLPPELRFRIWNYLFDGIFTKTQKQHNNKLIRCGILKTPLTYSKYNRITPHPLAILFCNRFINEETSHLLYRERMRLIRFDVLYTEEEEMIFFADVVPKFGTYQQIHFSCFEDALQFLRNFPLSRMERCAPSIRVMILGWCDPDDTKKLLEVTLKIVDTLKNTPNGKNIAFRTYHPRNRGPYLKDVSRDWFHQRFPQHKLPCWARGEERGHVVYDLRTGPFMEIPRWFYSALRATEILEQQRHEKGMAKTDT